MNDDELREHFRSLARSDAKRAPPFDAMWRKPKRSPWRIAAPVAGALAAAAVLLVWCATNQLSTATAPASAPLAIAQPLDTDPAPLDFLLDTPGLAELAGTPDFGTER
ncbi:MAG TPA: hypothetical protein VIF62_36270 [Labilithrix sp.]|jgi:hypothetical protein